VATISEEEIQKKLRELKSPKAYLDFALAMGRTKEDFIKDMTINKAGSLVLAFARKYSEALGMSVAEIRRIAGRIR